MKKFFLIPLMAMLCTVMAWGKDAHVSNITDLKAAVADASVETIYLDADIAYTSETVGSQINILRSLTIDGQGHTLAGCAKRTSSGNYNVLSINHNGSQMVDVTIKNITLTGKYDASHKANKPVETRGNIRSLTLTDVIIDNQDGPSGNNQGLTIGGAQATAANITMERTQILMNSSSYPVITFNPINLTMTGSKTLGYCSLYFKLDTYGGNNSTVTATDCDLDAPNPHSYSGGWNSFGLFVMQSGINGVNITLNNCGMNAQVTGNSAQGMLVSQGNNNLTINGDNSHINGEFVISDAWLPYTAGHITITGGTYAKDPSNIGTVQCYTFDEEHNIVVDEEENPVLVPCEVNCVPNGYEVQEVNQGGITLYRVVKEVAKDGSGDPLYDLNDNVEGTAEGENPVTSFELSTGTTMELNQETTEAGYVQVKDNGSDEGTTIKVGKILAEEKVDQTLVINNGLDVQGNSTVEVQAGSTLQIGEGGITTEDADNIVIDADKDGAGSLLLDPTITVNQTPNLTVRMLAQQIGRDEFDDYYWHRYAMPVLHIDSWEKEGSLEGAGSYVVQYRTYVYAWDYDANDWANINPNQMAPLKGYTLTLASDYIHVDGDGKVTSEATKGGNLKTLQDVTYIFKGNLVGNTDQALTFEKEGFNYFGNSYTGYMDALTVLNGIEDEHVDGTIYMWNAGQQTYGAVSKGKLEKGTRLKNWEKEIAPMQTFILRLRGADSANEGVSYADAIWNNPRYGNAAAPAPARQASVSNEDAYMEIIVTAANGKSDVMDFTEMTSKSDAFESGYDAEKYMNRKSLNLYADVDGINLSSVVTDNLLGKTLSLQTVNDMYYTMTFDNVEGNEYALLDKATNSVVAITNGASYAFSAQPNTTVENRFEIVSIHKVPTAVENVEAAVKARGIYTMLGQYMGEDINVLPAGVYVVNGVKIVK